MLVSYEAKSKTGIAGFF